MSTAEMEQQAPALTAPNKAAPEDSINPEELELLTSPSSSVQVTVPETVPEASQKPLRPKRTSKRKSHKKKRSGSEVQSVTTNSPSSSTMNDETVISDVCSSPVESTIQEASRSDDVEVPTVLVDPGIPATSAASLDEQILEVLRDIVRKCSVQDAGKRPSAAEVYSTLEKYL
ncbi:uncharacterized protein LOC135375162 [Ornithodoros turicata]|uniref:uncharacterized protein LOC135375162 n=1 Tax=Ornithodoros turicata TaxID=34597 RepID=UPI00313A3F7F